MKFGAIILVAGSGTRMGAGINKQLLTIGEQTITEITLRQFMGCQQIEQIVLVVSEMDLEAMTQLVGSLTDRIDQQVNQISYQEVAQVPISIVLGGAERVFSVANGVKALASDISHVLVHDGARPFVTKSLLQRLVAALSVCPAAIPVLPSKDTLKIVRDLLVTQTLDRSEIYRTQTPQAFERQLLENMQGYMLSAPSRDGFTDDASIAEAMGISVHSVLGCEWNIKLTTPEDMVVGQAIYQHLKGGNQCE